MGNTINRYSPSIFDQLQLVIFGFYGLWQFVGAVCMLYNDMCLLQNLKIIFFFKKNNNKTIHHRKNAILYNTYIYKNKTENILHVIRSRKYFIGIFRPFIYIYIYLNFLYIFVLFIYCSQFIFIYLYY